MKKCKIVVVLLTLFVIQTATAQHNYDSYNRFGIGANLAMFNIKTDNFNSKASTGFIGGFETRGSFYNNFDMTFGLSIMNGKMDIEVINPTTLSVEDANYDLLAAQLHIMLSYRLIGDYLAIDAGPVLMYNEQMKLGDSQANYLVNGSPTVLARHLQEINNFNFNAAVALTGGTKSFKVTAQYQYGINNILNKLNDQDIPNQDFKGRLSMYVVGAVIYL